MFLVIKKGDSSAFIYPSSLIDLGIAQPIYIRKTLSRTTFLASLSMSLRADFTFLSSSCSVLMFPLSRIVQPRAGLHPSKYMRFLSFEMMFPPAAALVL